MVGGQQFFERKEVKDVLAYLKLAINQSDEISLRRIINYPARGIGETSLEKLALHAATRQWSLWQAVERVDALDDVPAPRATAAARSRAGEPRRRRELFGAKRPPSEVARAIVERVALKGEIDGSSPTVGRGGQALGERGGRAGDAGPARGAGGGRRRGDGLTGSRRSSTR